MQNNFKEHTDHRTDNKDIHANELLVDDAAPTEMTKKIVAGVVVDCQKLNVRKTASPNGEVLAVIDARSGVVVDKETSTEEFYKIFTADGVEGFCMKKYIALNS